MPESLFPFRDLSRGDLIALVGAHREEYVKTYLEVLSPELDEARQALADFESEVLLRG